MHGATVALEYDAAPLAELVERSVRQEVGEIEGDRTRATVARRGRTVEVTVEADDLTALRAGLNTWTSLLSVAERVATE